MAKLLGMDPIDLLKYINEGNDPDELIKQNPVRRKITFANTPTNFFSILIINGFRA